MQIVFIYKYPINETSSVTHGYSSVDRAKTWQILLVHSQQQPGTICEEFMPCFARAPRTTNQYKYI